MNLSAQSAGTDLESLRSANIELRAEIAALHAALSGDLPHAIAWLQRKVLRQRSSLDALQAKGPGHTHAQRAEMAAAKALAAIKA